MNAIIIILISFLATGISIWGMSKREATIKRIFRFTSFEDENHIKHVFLVYSPTLELAQKDAVKMVIVNNIQIEKIEELDVKTWDVIATPVKNEKSSVKTHKIL